MDLKDKINRSKDKTKQWLSDHKGDIVYGCYIAACITAVIAPVIRKSRRNSLEAKREKQIYDPSMGFYWETKRTLTNNQKLMVEQRRRSGESLGNILRDMGVLKK